MRRDEGRSGSSARIRIDSRTLVLSALLVSLDVVLSRLASVRILIGGVEGVRLGFGAFPVVFAGIALGPLAGGIVGALGDLVGYWVNPTGIYMPHFTLAAALSGVVPPLIRRLFRPEDLSPGLRVALTGLAVGAGLGLSSVLLVPFFLKVCFGIPYLLTLPARVVSLAITTPVYAVLIETLLRRSAPLSARLSR